MLRPILALAASLALAPSAALGELPVHPWQSRPALSADTLAARIAPPAGFTRVPAAPGSWAEWLRRLPLKPAGAKVNLYTGAEKWRQDAHAAVIDIDTGSRDLQQCADAVMRLRAEWLWSIGAKDKIAFDYTGGGRVSYTRFARGERPSENGKRWSASGRADQSYAGFRRYMTSVFSYAGTYSLERELKPAADGTVPEIGDVVIKGGFPGHAVLVIDAVDNPSTGERRFLLAQSYMPAQDMHILKDPAGTADSPWYAMPSGEQIVTPEWTFTRDQLRRWP